MPKNALAQVLLDFGRTPGRYALRLREPRELYAQIDTLALWAQGRVPDGLHAQAEELEAAAVLFIQRACFAPENNHYQVLGLMPGPVDAEMLRTRYRSLIRLTHPDMGVQGLPSSAAGMVNRAQEVLANAELRERYDQQLEGSPRPSWQGVPVPPAPAPSAADVRSMQRARLDSTHHESLAERWRALWARYPTQARLLLTATGMGVLVVGLLAWAANDAPGGALVIARAPAQAAGAAGRDARNGPPAAAPAPVAAQAPDPTRAAPPAADSSDPNSARLALSRDVLWASAPPAKEAGVRAPLAAANALAAAAPAPARAREQAPAAPGPAHPQTLAEAAPPATSMALRPAPREASTTALAPSGSDAAVAPRPPPATPEAAPAPPARWTTAAAAPAPAAQPAPAPAAPPAPAPTPTPAPAPAPPPPPAPAAPPPAQWSVDVPGATQYLRDLVALLERPQEASRTHELLRSMSVKGTVLGPGLRLARDYPQIKVNALALTETRRPGALDLRGTLLLTAQNPQTAISTTVRYRVAAHFVGAEGGTALTRLDIQDPE